MDLYVREFDAKINDVLKKVMKKGTLIQGVVHLFLMLYAVKLAPELPKPVLKLFENAYFKLLIFSLILWTAQFNPSTSVLIAVGFMVTLNAANQKPLWEFIENTNGLPIAPNEASAIQQSAANISAQVSNSPIIAGVSQNTETTVITPNIVNTSQGPVVVNPSVVIAPAVVAAPTGEKIIVEPKVASIQSAPQPQQPQESGCYPVRKYDLANLQPYDNNDTFANQQL